MNDCFVYRHIRLDTNQPFYIGVGTQRQTAQVETNFYQRAYNKSGRNRIWKRIVEKTAYKIQIVLDNLTEKDAFEKEIELIAIYGRICDNKGTLANVSTGGEKTGKGTIQTEERKRKFSEKMKGRARPQYVREKISKSHIGIGHTDETKKKLSALNMGKKMGAENPTSRKVINVETGIIYDCISEAARLLKTRPQNLNRKINGTRNNNTSFCYLDDYENGQYRIKEKGCFHRKVINTQTGEIYKDVHEAALKLGIGRSALHWRLKHPIRQKALHVKIETPVMYLDEYVISVP